MKTLVKSSLAGVALLLAAGASSAITMDCEAIPGPDLGPALSISACGVTATGGYVGSGLDGGGNFMSSDITFTNIELDLNPANGGWGVLSGLGGDTDNFESSVNLTGDADEVIIFDFGMEVVLESVFFNGGAGTGHQTTSNDIWSIYFSLDGMNFASVVADSVPALGETLAVLGGTAAQYWAVSNTQGRDGGYVQGYTYSNVPEASSLALLGLGLMGLGFARRRK